MALDRNAEAGSATGIPLQDNPALAPEFGSVRRTTAVFHQVERTVEAGYMDPSGGLRREPRRRHGASTGPNPARIQSQALDPELVDLAHLAALTFRADSVRGPVSWAPPLLGATSACDGCSACAAAGAVPAAAIAATATLQLLQFQHSRILLDT